LTSANGILGAAAALDEGIKHQVEKLVGELEGHLLRPGRNLAGELIERVGQIAAGQPKEGQECRRQHTAVVEEVVDRMSDVELVDGEGR
jgi:hypothetical protein